MADMANERAVRLMQLKPATLAFILVSLGDVNGDDALIVAGQNLW